MKRNNFTLKFVLNDGTLTYWKETNTKQTVTSLFSDHFAKFKHTQFPGTICA